MVWKVVFLQVGPTCLWKTIYGGPTCPWDASPPYARVVHTDAAMVVPVSWLTRGGEARWWLGLGVEGKGGRQEKVGEDTTSSFPCMSRRRVPPHARTHATSELLPAYVPQPVTPPSARTVASDSSPRARRGWLLARVTDRDPSPCAPWRQDPSRLLLWGERGGRGKREGMRRWCSAECPHREVSIFVPCVLSSLNCMHAKCGDVGGGELMALLRQGCRSLWSVVSHHSRLQTWPNTNVWRPYCWAQQPSLFLRCWCSATICGGLWGLGIAPANAVRTNCFYMGIFAWVIQYINVRLAREAAETVLPTWTWQWWYPCFARGNWESFDGKEIF